MAEEPRQSPGAPFVEEIELKVWGHHSGKILQYRVLERWELHTEL